MITQQSPADALFDEIEEWSRHQTAWSILPTPEMHRADSHNESSAAKAMLIQTPQGKIYLEPIGEDKTGAFVVEMYAWPTLIRVFLVRKPKNSIWEVRTDAGFPFHWDWNETNFVRLVNDLQVLP